MNSSNNNYSVIHTGKLENINQSRFSLESLGTIQGKHFLKDELNLSGMEVSLNILPTKTSMPFFHKHNENEELYIFVKGSGQFQVDNEIFDVSEGSVVRVTPVAERTWQNNSPEDLTYFVIQAKENSLTGSTVEDGVITTRTVNWEQTVEHA